MAHLVVRCGVPLLRTATLQVRHRRWPTRCIRRWAEEACAVVGASGPPSLSCLVCCAGLELDPTTAAAMEDNAAAIGQLPQVQLA